MQEENNDSIFRPSPQDIRDELIRRVVKGKTFVDVGGLQDIFKEKVSVAAQAGAAELTIIDIAKEPHPFWGQFRKRMEHLNVQGVRCLSGDIMVMPIERYDVVYSSGVLYHIPDPMRFLVRLKEMARHWVILTSTVIPRPFAWFVPDSTVLFFPSLDGWALRFLRCIFNVYKTEVGSPNQNYRVGQYCPNWWLPTRSALGRMCQCAGFHIEDQGGVSEFPAHTLLLRPE